MSGTLFGIPLSQRVDVNGRPESGWLLYLYAAGTLTPADAFQDTGLTTALLLPWPLEADSFGMIPQFWLADGSYRARATTANGILLYDIDGIAALGPSTGSGGGGGGTVSGDSVLQTGDLLWSPKSGTRSGFIRANGRTFGSAASGASERANSDTQALYEDTWNNFSNSLCPVGGGRGASAVDDFNANKPMAYLDLRGRAPFGLDDMGTTAAGRITGGTTPGAAGGTETFLQAHLPSGVTLLGTAASHTHGLGTLATASSGSHTHGYDDHGSGSTSSTSGGLSPASTSTQSRTTDSSGAHTHSLTGALDSVAPAVTVDLGGSGTKLLPPYVLGSWYAKL